MTRYSETRGIMYSAPPGPEEDEAESAAKREEATAEPTAADDQGCRSAVQPGE